MNLNEANEDNLKYIIDEMAKKLQVVNRSIMDPKDYKLESYDQLKELYDMLEHKGNLSVPEIQAFIEELSSYRK
ncbi:DUF1128 domain-containing protein [Radiobacillus kanasensis]|uniref:DUF1128 domain-containing protein n=1 Tax=Radiobacillus kanasensis TaxID=2844358 RepID=UPI001E597BA9|nr:DUF1128 domain-containing protein [Radiobacillus kanasensis]UFU00997.1 DUF1128 domain-containing protein [Radiobacillus kanasensis]